jgi:hypothetical protein
MSEEDLWNTIEADADAFEDFTTEAGTELASLIRQVGRIKTELIKNESCVKLLKEQRDRYLFDLIPAKMQETGVEEVKVGGNTVSLMTFVNGTMPKDPMQRDIALSHLREIGASDFIKNEISVSFPVSEDNRARAMQADLEEKGFETSAKTWVEPSTLKRLIRERVEAGLEIDLDIFNANIGTIAKIKGE